jgi:phage tail protein X
MNIIPYITRDGDRWDLIAWDHYGDATAYEPIVAANPQVPISATLAGGILLEIPVLDDPAPTVTGLPPWKTP